MRLRLRALVLLAVMAVSATGPTATVWLHAAETGMGCCATDDQCQRVAMQRACCPCAPSAPADPPSATRALAAAPSLAPVTPWCLVTSPHEGAIPADAARALLRGGCQSSTDPPWLLHGAILI